MKTEELNISIPEYDSNEGFRFQWADNFSINVTCSDNEVTITANQQGLRSLANHLLNLSQEAIPVNYHIHLDETNGLKKDSAQLIIEKK